MSIRTLVASRTTVGAADASAFLFTVGGLSADGAAGTVTFSDGTRTVQVAVASDGAYSADLRSLTDGTIAFSLQVTGDSSGSGTVPGGPLMLDATAPAVSSVTASPGTADLAAGQVVLLSLSLSEAVYVDTAGGTPTLLLNDGGTASYVSGSGASTLVFRYTVGAGENTSDLAVTGTALNGGTIRDAAGNAADLAGAAVNPAGTLVIDTVAPTVALDPASFGGSDDVLSAAEAASAGLTVAGTTTGVENGQVATVSLIDAGTGTATASYAATVTNNAWSVVLSPAQAQAIADGSYTVQADVSDRAGNAAPSAARALRIDRTAPVIAIAPPTGDGTANAAEAAAGFAISGATVGVEDGQVATIVLANSSNAILGSYTATVSGNAWSVTVTPAQAQALANGTYTVRANIVDQAGNPSAQATQALRVDKTPPSLALTAPVAGDNVVNAAEAGAGFTVQGTTLGVEAGQSVLIRILDGANGVVDTVTATVAANAWSASVSAAQAAALSDGAYTLAADVTDLAGNPAATATRSLRVDKTAPTIAVTAPIAGDGAVSVAEAAAGFAIRGTTVGVEDGRTAAVSVFDASNVLTNTYSATVSGNAWTVSVSAAQAQALVDGTYTVRANVSDQAGNPAPQAAATFRMAGTAPTVAVSALAGGDDVLNLGESAAGTALAGRTTGIEDGQVATVEILDGSNAVVGAYSATVTSGAWSVALTPAQAAALVDGGYTVRASASDSAGNAALPATRALVVDRAAPAIAIAATAGDDALNRGETASSFAISGTTAGVEDGQAASVRILDAGLHVIADLPVTVTGGAWSLDVSAAQARALADGTYTIRADVSDLAGNPAATATRSLRVDKTPPAIAIGAITGDDEIDPGEAGSGFTIGGTTTGVEDGQVATIRILDSAQTLLHTYAATIAGGTWSVSVPAADASALPVGSYLVRAAVSDQAGNPAEQPYRVMNVSGSSGGGDTTPPTVLLVSASPEDADLRAGRTATLTLTMSETTFVDTTGGTPTLLLSSGGTATYVSGSGSTDLVFSYLVGTGDTAADLAVTSASPNGGAIQDAAGNAADLSRAAANPYGILRIDTTAPTVAAVSASPGTAVLAAGQTATLTLGLSEAVFVDTAGGTPTLLLSSGGAAAYVSGSGTSTLVFRYAVGAGENSADLTVTGSALNGGTILDAAGNPADLAGAVADPAGTLRIDTTAPSVAITGPLAGGDDAVNIAEAAAGFAIAGTTAGVEDGQVATIRIVDAGGTAVDTYSATVAAGTWSVAVTAAQATTLANGSYTVQADVSDFAGNPALQANRYLRVDQTGPSSSVSVPGVVNVAGAASGFSISGSTVGVENGQAVAVRLLDGSNGVVGAYGATVLNNAWSVGITPAQARALADGSYTVQADVSDLAGNPAPRVTRSLRVDETAPVLVISPVAGDNTVNLAEAGAGFAIAGTISAEDGQAVAVRVFDAAGVLVNTYSAAVSGGAWSAGVTAAQARALVNGSYLIRVDGSDQAGNPATQATRTLLVDETPPTLAITGPIAGNDVLNLAEAGAGVVISGATGGMENGQPATIRFVDGSNAVAATLTATVTGNAWSVLLTPAQARALLDGSYTVQADVSDLAGNPAPQATRALLVDETAPAVSSVIVSPGSGVFKAGQAIEFTLGLSEAVSVDTTGGTPTLALNDGGTAAYVSGSGASSLVFRYTVGAGQNTADLAVTGSNLNGGTILDAAGNAANLAGAAVNPAGTLEIDTVAPTVTSVLAFPATATLRAGDVVDLTVSLSEAVTVTGMPRLTLSGGGTASYLSGSGTDTLVFRYTVGAGQNTADLAVTGSNLNGGTILDAAGNAANLAGAAINPAGTLVIDTAGPTVSSVVASPNTASLREGQTATLTLNMSESFSIDTTVGTPTLALNDGGTATYLSATSTSLTFTYTVLSGQNTADLAVAGASLNGSVILDAVGNASTLAGAAGANPAGVLRIDTVAPTIASVTASPSNGARKAGQTATLTLNMSEAVTVSTAGGTPTLLLNNGATATYASGSGSSALLFDYTVAPGQDVGDLAVNTASLNGATIQDAAGNDASLAGAANANPSGTLRIDTVAPTVASVTASPATASLNAGQVVLLTLGMSEAVSISTAGGTPTLALNDGGTAAYVSGSGTSSLVFRYTVGAGQNTVDLAVTGTALNGGTILDAAGNAADLAGAAVNPAGTLLIDTVAPTVTSVTASPSGGTLRVGDTVDLTVSLSEAVTVTGTPRLALSGGGAAAYVSGSGTDTLVFRYTVGAGQNTPDLAVTGSSLNGGTILDVAGNPADLAGVAADPAGTLVIDTIAPAVSSIAASPGTAILRAGQAATLTLNMSEVVLVDATSGTPTLLLNDGGIATYLSGSGGTALVFGYTVLAGQNTPDLAVVSAALNGGTIRDAAGNAANLAGAAGVNPAGVLQIDTTPPTVASVAATPGTASLRVGQTVTLTLTMSETVTVSTGGGTPTLLLNNGAAAAYASGSGSNILGFTYQVAAGEDVADLTVVGASANGGTILDAAGNPADLAGAAVNPAGTLLIDTTAPLVNLITASPATADLGAGQIVVLTIAMSEPVLVDATGGTPTLLLNSGGTAAYLSGSGSNTLLFRYVVGAGQDTPDLAVTGVALNGGTILDATGNAANLAGAIANPAGTLQIDTTAPSIAITATLLVGSDDVLNRTEAASGYTVSGATVGVEDGRTATVRIVDAGTNAIVDTFTTAVSGNAWSITASAARAQALADGLYTVQADASDLAGNPATTATRSLRVDETDPMVLSITASPSGAVLNAGQTVTLTLAMSEAVTVGTAGGTPTLALNSGGTASYLSGSGTSTLLFSYVVGAGENAADLAVTGSSLNGGTILDAAGNAANLAGAVANPAGTLLIDTAAPSLTIAGPIGGDGMLDRIEAAAGFSVAGTAAGVEDGRTVAVTIVDGGTGLTVASLSTTAAGGAWTVGVTAAQATALADGSYAVRADASDLAGNPAPQASRSLRIDRMAPAASVAAAAGDDTLNLAEAAAGFVLSGTTAGVEDGQVATVRIFDGANAVVDTYAATVNGGAWSALVSSAQARSLADGTYTIGLDVADQAGNPAARATRTLQVDQTAPGIQIDAPLVGDGALNRAEAGAGFTISGTTTGIEDGRTVVLRLLDGANVAAGAYAATVTNGAWSVALTPAQAQALLDGTYAVQADASDAAGNPAQQAARTLVVDETAPTAIAVTASPATADLPAGQVVLLTLALSEAVLVDTNSGTPSLLLSNGGTAGYVSGSGTNALLFSYTVGAGEDTADLAVTGVASNSAIIRDAAGNPANLAGAVANPGGMLRIDTTAPSIAITGPLVGGDDVVNLAEAAAGFAVSGTATGVEDGQAATVTFTDSSGAVVGSHTATVSGGTWSVAVLPAEAHALADGAYTVAAAVSDAAGNPAPLAARSFRIDQTVPSAAIFGPVAGDDVVSRAEAHRGFTIAGATVGVEDGRAVAVRIVDAANAAVLSYAAPVAGGAWSVSISAADASILADGGYTVQADVSDLAGNPALQARRALLVDETAPAAPAGLALAPESDTGLPDDGVTSQARPIVTGVAEPGSTVQLRRGDILVGTGVADAVTGAWSITALLEEGANLLTATATDAAGNLSVRSSLLLVTLDTSAPAAPTGIALAPASDSGVPGDDVTSVRQPTLIGVAEPGSTVRLLLDDDTIIGVGTASAQDGTWAITASAPLALGPNRLTATAIDAAGNVSARSDTRAVTLSGLPVGIAGLPASQGAVPAVPLAVLGSISVADPSDGATDAATLTLTDAEGRPTDANGTLAGPGLLKTGSPGAYALAAASPAELTSMLQAVLFTPAAQPAGSDPVTTGLTLTVGNPVTGLSASSATSIAASAPWVLDAPTPTLVADGAPQSAPSSASAAGVGVGGGRKVITNTSGLAFAGRIAGGAKVALYSGDAQVGGGLVDPATGAYSAQLAGPLALGGHQVKATATNASGTLSASSDPTSLFKIEDQDAGFSTTDNSSRDIGVLLEQGYGMQFSDGTEAVLLVDGVLSVGVNTDQAYMQRLYEGLFGRGNDAGGISDWNDRRTAGLSKSGIARGFLDGEEYRTTIGAQTDEQFLGLLYKGFLGRSAAEAPDAQFWRQRLADGMTRADVLASIGDSEEAKAYLAPTTAQVWVRVGSGTVAHTLFETGLGREIELPALESLKTQMQAGTTPQDIARDMVTRPEFLARHAGEDSAAYVASLYQAGLGRDLDQTGQALWADGLDSGALTRADVLLGVALSTEAHETLTRTL